MTANRRKALSPVAARMIGDGLRKIATPAEIQAEVNTVLGEAVPLNVIAARKENRDETVQTKLFFKRKGADFVRDFLDKARGGEDVSELETVLTHAVYLDLLRRYATEAGLLDNIEPKELLKLANEYRKTRISSLRAGEAQGKRMTARAGLELLDVIASGLVPGSALAVAFEGRKEALMEKIKTWFDAEEYESAKEDFDAMQELAQARERERDADDRR